MPARRGEQPLRRGVRCHRGPDQLEPFGVDGPHVGLDQRLVDRPGHHGAPEGSEPVEEPREERATDDIGDHRRPRASGRADLGDEIPALAIHHRRGTEPEHPVALRSTADADDRCPSQHAELGERRAGARWQPGP